MIFRGCILKYIFTTAHTHTHAQAIEHVRC